MLFFIPVLGFVLYLIFGQTFHREKMFKVKVELDKSGKSLLKEQLEELQEYKAGPSDDEYMVIEPRKVVFVVYIKIY